jgi:general secretion pathway protein G
MNGHGDWVTGRYGEDGFAVSPRRRVSAFGFSLVELVITVAVLAILTLGVIPLVQVTVKRQKEQELRAALRTMREAIDQFHREALAAPQVPPGTGTGTRTGGTTGGQGGTGGAIPQSSDPRIRVYVSDPTIFTTDNPDRYPPDLDTLVKGVSVLPFAMPAQLVGGQGITGEGILEKSQTSTIPKTKVYLRQIPIDPMTGQKDWVLRSCYDATDSTSWGGENVFDVHSKSDGVPLDGKGKYSDW